VTGINRMWSAARCDERYKAPAIQLGLRQVLGGRSASFSEDCEDAGGRYRITVTRHGRGALIIQQLVDSSASPRSERMATVGRLLGGVAHDFANLLTLIGGYSDLLLNRVREQDPLWAGLDEIRKAAQRGSRLTGQLLGFTRGQSVQLKSLDLNVI